MSRHGADENGQGTTTTKVNKFLELSLWLSSWHRLNPPSSQTPAYFDSSDSQWRHFPLLLGYQDVQTRIIPGKPSVTSRHISLL